MKRKLTREEAAEVESAYAREGDEGVLFLLVRLMGGREGEPCARAGGDPAAE